MYFIIAKQRQEAAQANVKKEVAITTKEKIGAE